MAAPRVRLPRAAATRTPALFQLVVNRLDGTRAEAARLANPLELLLQLLQLLVGQVLQVRHARARALDGAQQLVELQVQGLRVAVLRSEEHTSELQSRF